MASNTFIDNITKGINLRLKEALANPYRSINLNWFKIKYYKHLPAGKVKTHRLFGKKLHFTDSGQLVEGLEEIFIEEAYKQALPEHPYIIDCGANIGLSVIYMKRQYPHAEIIAFEPDETNYQLLTENINSFGYEDVILKKDAVWVDNTELNFSNDGSMGSKIEKNAIRHTTKVNAIRLKDLLTRKVDFLKMDIEGAEYEVIMDISDKLHQIDKLFVEYHGTFAQNNELSEMLAVLNRVGFKFYIKEAAVLFQHPFCGKKRSTISYDVQLNIFCFRSTENYIKTVDEK